ncbi:ABC transporter permease [Candidatus Woesearchaeota archaeon]|nr:ABC transporter permease [Candidatus Woesearchaeota archaeon]
MKLDKIMYKNFKILFRSKSSALVIILGPLVLIILVGLAFSNSSALSVNVGYHSYEDNELVNSYISQIDTETYTLQKYSSIEECKENIKLSSIHACISFPQDFEITNNKTNEIIFYVDKSKINLVYNIIDTVKRGFSLASSNLSMELTGNILEILVLNKQGILLTQEDLDELIELNEELKEESFDMQKKLNTIVIDTKEASKTSGSISSAGYALRDNLKDFKDLSNEVLDEAVLLETYGVAAPSQQDNWSDTTNLLFDYNDDAVIFYAWNDTEGARLALMSSVSGLTGSVTMMLDDVDEAKKNINRVSESLKDDIDAGIDEKIDMIGDIKNDLAGITALIDNIEISEAESIVNPITTTIETINPQNTHLGYLFPSLIVLLIMFISILLSSNLILMEKNSKAYFRNFTTPTNDSLFILSTYLTGIVMTTFQIALVLVIAALLFKAPILDNLGLIVVLVFIIESVFIFIGMAIGYVFNSEETAMIGAISITSLFLLLSDLILPLESMPPYILKVAKLNPFVLGSETLREAMLFNVKYEFLKSDLWTLIGFSMVILLLMIAIQQVMKFTYLSSFDRKKVKISKKTNIKDYFKINNESVTDLDGLIKVIRHMSEKDFKKHIKGKNVIARWIVEVQKNIELAEKVKEKKKKEDIIFLLKRAMSAATAAQVATPPPAPVQKDEKSAEAGISVEKKIEKK